MPRTGVKRGPKLAIEIDHLRTSYLPGDTITGRVIRTAQIAKAESWVCVALYGRSKAKFAHKVGGATVIHRSRFNFFDSMPQTIHQGPMHVAPEGEGAPSAWPFSITIPSTMSIKALNDDENQGAIVKGDIFLPVDADSVSQHRLPPVFFGPTKFMGKWHGYVEYYVEAQLGLARSSKDNASVVQDWATFPLFIRLPSTPKPTIDFGLSLKNFPCSRSAYALVPGMEEMSLRKRTKQLFRSSTCPRFVYDLEVHYPTVLQLANPNPIPLLVKVVPNLEETSDDVACFPQAVVLTEIDMELIEVTEIIITGTLGPYALRDAENNFFGLHPILKGASPEVVLPVGRDVESLNAGTLLQIRLGTQGVTAVSPSTGKTMTMEFEHPLAPSFATHNVRCTHVLRCYLSVSVAGGTTAVVVEEPTVVIGMSEEQANRAVSELGYGGGMDAYDAELAKHGFKVGMEIGEVLGDILAST